MKKDVFIPIRVDEDDNVDLTFEEFEGFINEAYDSGFKDGMEAAKKSIGIQDTKGHDPIYPYNPVYPYVTWDFSKGPNDIPDVNWAKGSYTTSSSTSKDYIALNGGVSFDECINFLKNKQKK